MATYGLGTPGAVPFTGYTNSLSTGQANMPAVAGQVYFNGITQADDKIAKMLRTGGMSSAVTQMLLTLLGAAVGGTATKTKAQVRGVVGGSGGPVPVETITLVNRATTAADLTAFQGLVNRTVFPATYIADVSGNGGGGKLTQASGNPY